MISASAPGKVILFGEHAVVYGRPAIAVPVTQVRATAVVTPNESSVVTLIASDLGTIVSLEEADTEDALAIAVRQVQQAARLAHLPGFTLTVASDIPIASGLGSGAAVTAAVVRAVATYLDLPQLITNEWVSAVTYEVEKIHHGTPSGIDNTVVSFESPVYFRRRQPQNHIETIRVPVPLHLLIGDTGIGSATKSVVGDVRRRWEADRRRFEALFDECGRITESARLAIETGDVATIGRLMTANHAVLVEMTVSSPALDQLVAAAISAGALGAKMSGAGRGGNMVALVTENSKAAVHRALLSAGARSVLSSIIQS